MQPCGGALVLVLEASAGVGLTASIASGGWSSCSHSHKDSGAEVPDRNMRGSILEDCLAGNILDDCFGPYPRFASAPLCGARITLRVSEAEMLDQCWKAMVC
jgi:hypothetical protein